jgi:folate-dependent phosphoribosylglycinamide formyltransferase PurN
MPLIEREDSVFVVVDAQPGFSGATDDAASAAAQSRAMAAWLAERDVELVVLAGYMHLLTPVFLDRFRDRIVNVHPSLLPRHRGIAAVEWTIREADPIAGGSIYHLADRMDAGAIAAQDWCFVKKGESARELWERALAPMGLALIAKVIRYAKEHGTIPAQPQDEQFATKAPLIRD